jgi:hypothetical protein
MYLEEAQRLYVNEQLGVLEIAERLHLGEKTVRIWRDEGKWKEKRSGFLKQKQAFHDEMYVFVRKLMHAIQDDMDNGVKIDQGRLYTFTKLVSTLGTVKNYEEARYQKEEKQEKGLTPDIVELIEKEVLGINRD